jgi:hypothetical protein
VALLIGSLAAAGACGSASPERQLLEQFFRASRQHDTTALARVATVSLNPRTDGTVEWFEILEISADRRVTVQAQLRTPAGRLEQRTLELRLERRDGRWMVTGLTRLPASRTSP